MTPAAAAGEPLKFAPNPPFSLFREFFGHILNPAIAFMRAVVL